MMVGYGVGGAAFIVAVAWFAAWLRRESKKH
jgi:hypothetical protein